MLLILVGLLITCFLLLWSLSKPFYWKRKGISYLFPLPLFGSNLQSMKMSLADFYMKLYQNYPNERFFGFHFFMKPTLVVKDTALIKDICTRDFEYFTASGMYSNEDNDPFGANLLFLHGQAWKEIRVKLTTLFTPSKLRNIHDFTETSMAKANRCIQEKMMKNEPVEIVKMTVGIATDIVVQAMFGIETDSFEENSHFIDFGKKMFNKGANTRLIMGIIAPELIDFFKLKIYDNEVTNFLTKVLKDIIKFRKNNKINNQDFIGNMMHLMEENEGKPKEKYFPDKTRVPDYSFKTLLAQALILMSGGIESSAMTMAFFLYEASLNQEIQEKCRTEIMSIVNETGCDIRPEDIHRLTYLDMALKETMRKYPPFIILTRKCTKEYKVPESNLTIDPGTFILMLIRSIQWDPKNYPNPEAFIPERFSNTNNIEDGAYITWGLGPRTCIGKQFAKMEMFLVISRLLRTYRFKLSSKTEVPIKVCPYNIVLTPDPGIYFDIEQIENKN